MANELVLRDGLQLESVSLGSVSDKMLVMDAEGIVKYRDITETSLDSNYVSITGDTMTGDLTVNGYVNAYRFIGPVNTSITGATSGPIFYPSTQYPDWGIFYNQGTPDTIDFRKAGVTTASIDIESGNYSGAKFIKYGGTASQFLKADGSVDSTSYLPRSGGTMTGELFGNYNTLKTWILDTLPEGSLVHIPSLYNDLAHLTLRNGGSATSTSNVQSIHRLFNGKGDFAVINTSEFGVDGTTPVVIDITTVEALSYGCKVGIAFGNATWRAKDVKIEAFSEGAWVTCIDVTDFGGDTLMASIPGNSGVGTTAFRITLNRPNNAIRIVHFWAVDYNSVLGQGLFLGRDGGDVYGDINLTNGPNGTGLYFNDVTGSVGYIRKNNTGSQIEIGSDNAIYFKETDADVITGTFTTNTGSFDMDGALTASSIVKSGGTSSQFLKADGSVDGNTYALASNLHTQNTDTGTTSTTFTIREGFDNTTSSGYGLFFGGNAGVNSAYLRFNSGTARHELYSNWGGTGAVLGALLLNSIIANNSVTANSFIKSGGTSSQFLKADGSVDSNTYLTSESDTLQSVTNRGNTTTNGITVGSIIDNTTNIGKTSTVYTTIADGGWNKPVGYSIMAKSDSVGGVNQAGYWTVLGRRDTGGGYSGIFTSYISGGSDNSYIGFNADGALNPTWHKIWTDNNLTNVSQLTNDAGYLTAIPNFQQVLDAGSNEVTTGIKVPYVQAGNGDGLELYGDDNDGTGRGANIKIGGNADATVDINIGDSNTDLSGELNIANRSTTTLGSVALTNIGAFTWEGNTVATQSWVNAQGFGGGGSYLPLSGGELTGALGIGTGGTIGDGTRDTLLHVKGSGSVTGGRTDIMVQNTNVNSAASFRVVNSNGKFMAAQVSGPSYTTGERASFSTSDGLDFNISTDSGTASGGASIITLSPGGYNETPVMTLNATGTTVQKTMNIHTGVTDGTLLRFSHPASPTQAGYEISFSNTNLNISHSVEYSDAFTESFNIERQTGLVTFGTTPKVNTELLATQAWVSGSYAPKANAAFTGTTTYDRLNGPAGSDRDKIRVYSSNLYTIGMQDNITYGSIGTDWCMTFQMNNANTRGFWWGDDAHSINQGAMSLTTNGKLTVASGIRVGYGESDTTVMGTTYDIQAAGDIQAADFVGSSDIRKKTDITAYEPNKLNTTYKTYKFKDDENNRQRFGVIAQEIEKDHPEFVRTADDGMKSVSYQDLHSAEIAYLKDKVKSQDEKIEKQGKEISELKELVQKLINNGSNNS